MLDGKSNIVICERNGDIVEGDITYALKLDRMYKGKLQAGDLDEYDEKTVEAMQAECVERRNTMQNLYNIQLRVNL